MKVNSRDSVNLPEEITLVLNDIELKQLKSGEKLGITFTDESCKDFKFSVRYEK
jgi:hypothetical protein